MLRRAFLFLLLFPLAISMAGVGPVAPQAQAQAAAPSLAEGRRLQGDAAAAYRDGDIARARDLMGQALENRPGHLGIHFNMAFLSAAEEDYDAALGYLRAVARMGLAVDTSAQAFAPLQNMPEFQAIVARFEENLQSPGHASLAFSTDVPMRLAEGIAYDPVAARYFISSIYDRTVYAMSADGVLTPFMTDEAHALMMGAMGMVVDNDHGLLWVATSALPQMKGYSESADGMAGVFALDLASGEVRHRYMFPPTAERKHVFGDVLVTDDDQLYLSNSVGSQILHLSSDGAIQRIITLDNTASLQGMALSPDATKLIVADYTTGLHLLDRESGETRQMVTPARTNLMAIDGLYAHGNNLIAIQNGVTPHRVLYIRMAEDWSEVEEVEVLEANHPLFAEPTLGVVRGDAFYFIANSGWQEFGNPENITPDMLAGQGAIHILRIDLPRE